MCGDFVQLKTYIMYFLLRFNANRSRYTLHNGAFNLAANNRTFTVGNQRAACDLGRPYVGCSQPALLTLAEEKKKKKKAQTHWKLLSV